MNKSLTIQIALDNAAFEDDPGVEVARILRQIADKCEGGEVWSGPIRDINGNLVGEAGVYD
jgi:hypothetical protein